MQQTDRKETRGIRSALRHRDFRFLAGAQAISGLGNWIYSISLIVYVYERTGGSPGWIAATTFARAVPYLFFSFVGGVIADRHDRKKVMIGTDVARGCLMGVMALVAAVDGSLLLLIVLAASANVFSAAYLPSVRASTPALVGEEDLAGANTVITVLDNVSMALGPAVGGVLMFLGSASTAFTVNAATFFLSASLTVPIRTRLTTPSDQPDSAPEPFKQRAAEGFRTILSSSSIRVVMLLTVAATLFYGQEIVLYTVTAGERLGIGESGVGFMFAAMGLGGILAAGLVGRLGRLRRQFLVLSLATIASGIPMAALTFVSESAVVFGLMIVEGAAVLICDVVSLTVLQRLLPRQVLGRVLGISDALSVAGILTGSLIAPLMVQTFGLNAALLFATALITVPVLVVLPRARGIDARTADRGLALKERAAVLAGARLFEGAGAQMLESLAASAEPEQVAPGDVVVRQGEEPDDLFVVVSGHFVVDAMSHVGTPAPVAELGAGDHFGEIGLIERTPRTATVTATEEGQLLRISGSDFLEIASDDPGLQGLLRAGIAVRLARSRASTART